ncbi:hypothetical protein FNV43_RR08108 [Rhamnella rubrinervis]|uniref:VWFA domain-containing protein n=1 Tax=Rhamnella rubrinervis TaxID=2594499 RepID=A0A8K0HFW7_9ROSA|nr:hypothetical protein FNV43_RR08108 [Rhamnella rubrinervis]
MAAAEFSSCVEYGLQLSKRIYYGKESVTAPAVEPPAMSRSSDQYLPAAPMVYAVISEPTVVDNPEIPSYQPYVHGRCEPPALIPLHMHGISMEIDSYLDTAFITVSGTWRVHCVMAGRRCDCRIAVPMGEKGSLLGVEVEVTGRSYRTQLISKEDAGSLEKVANAENGSFIKSQIYTIKVPQVEGGSFLSMKISWSQKLLYNVGEFCLRVPFTFPAYVTPVGKKISKRENILVKVNSGTSTEVLCKSTSHPLKELRRQSGKLSFSYEAEVSAWSRTDFRLSYTVHSSDIFGGVLLQSPSLLDFDEREIFCLYMFPGNTQIRKVFRKEVVFVIDKSGSMRGRPLEDAKNALLASLSNLNPEDAFNIIAFDGEVHLFSPSMELATKEAMSKATEWVGANLVANGGTNILLPMEQAMKMLGKGSGSIPFIFLITDGAVEEEREICNIMKGYLKNGGSICPRICTFGIGLYCNHYFLQMLAQIGKGCYDAAYDADSIDFRMQRLFTGASSVILADITLNTLDHLDSLEFFPSHIPDLSSGNPLIISGRYDGVFPDFIKANGTLADMSNFVIDMKVQRVKDFPLNRVLARRQIDMLTSHAWLSGSKELEEKVAKFSKQTGVPSEHTCMILAQMDKGTKASEPVIKQEVHNKLNQLKEVESKSEKILYLGSLGIGFGNLTATTENVLLVTEVKPSAAPTDFFVKAASNWCSRMVNRCCCMCCIQACSTMNNQCAIVLTQLCTALACCQCLNFSPLKMKIHADGCLSKFIFFFLLFSDHFSCRLASNGTSGKEKTLAIIKPDGLFGNHTDKIKNAVSESGFTICEEKIVQLDEESVMSFYAEHSSKSFFGSLVKYMTSGPVLLMILEKENAVADWRALIGPTDARKAKITHPHSIRALCGQNSEKNCVHGSDSPQSAQREISFFFEEKSSGSVVQKHDEL